MELSSSMEVSAMLGIRHSCTSRVLFYPPCTAGGAASNVVQVPLTIWQLRQTV